MDPKKLFANYNPNGVYQFCGRFVVTKLTKLMYLIVNIKKIANGNEVIKKYIKHHKKTVNEKCDIGWTALHMAAVYSKRYNLLDIAKTLIKYDANINAICDNDYTPLILAAWFSNASSSVDTVRLLLDRGANVNIIDKENDSALIAAGQNIDDTSNIETVKLLVERGADVTIKDVNGDNILTLVLTDSEFNNHIDGVRTLLDYGVDVNFKKKNGDTTLMIALENNKDNIEIIRLLLDRGADVNATNKLGDTPLMIACKKFNIPIISLLIERGADVNRVNTYKKNALHVAAKYIKNQDRKCVIRKLIVLIENGADIYKKYENKLFLDYLDTDTKTECLKLINEISYHKLSKKRVLDVVKKYSRTVMYKPTSISAKTTELHFNLVIGMNYEICREKYRNEFDYFGICDDETFEKKIKGAIMHMDFD